LNVRIYGDDLLTNLLTYAVNSIPGAVGAGLSVAADLTAGRDGEGSPCVPVSPEGRADGSPRSVAAVGVATRLDPAQWKQANGPLWDAFRSGETLIRPTMTDPEDRVLGLDGLHGLDGALNDVRGVVVSAGEWGGELPVVLSIYLDRTPDAKVLRAIDRHEPLVTQALALVEYCAGEEQVARQMLEMTQYRRVIEQAKGLVMGASGSDAATAFATLARASQHFNVKLRNLTIALVEHVGGASAEHPDDPELVVRPSAEEREIASRVWAALTTTTAIMPAVERQR
jgi:ANTAR domain-containing protein